MTVVVDTEEEFDWSSPVSRNATSVRHMREIGRLQRVFDEYSIRPTYVIDYPIASQQESIQPLKELARDGRAVIGAHLHTWVSPPFEEEPTARFSFQGNLPRHLEAAKMRRLKERIAESFCIAPVWLRDKRHELCQTKG